MTEPASTPNRSAPAGAERHRGEGRFRAEWDSAAAATSLSRSTPGPAALVLAVCVRPGWSGFPGLRHAVRGGGASGPCWTPASGRPGGLPGRAADDPRRDRATRSGTRTGRTTWPRWLGADCRATWRSGRPATWPPGRAAARTRPRGMVVVPASTAACAGIAIGLSKDLLQRAAEVNLKERRPVVRGAAGDAGDPQPPGAPARPARRRRGGVAGEPRLLRRGRARRPPQQLVDFVAGKVLDAIGVPHTLFTPVGRRSSPTARPADQ